MKLFAVIISGLIAAVLAMIVACVFVKFFLEHKNKK